MKGEPPVTKRGFTLIELLIVIAIILILIAIALPNFLEAQIRARVTKAKGEIRSLAIAMDSYYIDFNIYPAYSFPNYKVRGRFTAGLTWLTSPIAYIKSLPEDPFPPSLDPMGGEIFGGAGPYSYNMTGYEITVAERSRLSHPNACAYNCGYLKVWTIYSAGPDSPNLETIPSDDTAPIMNGSGSGPDAISSYNPTNGTKSRGDILRYGGDQRWMGVKVPQLVASDASFATYPRPGQTVDGELYISRFPGHLTH
jgi:prepilin-type N-terminal cleavage/methylation domain-containing protein